MVTRHLTTMITILGALIAILLSIDSRYVKAVEQEQINKQTIQILETFKQQVEQSINHQKEIYKIQEEKTKNNFLIERKYKLKDLLRKYPDDADLIVEYNEIITQLKKLNI